MRKKMCVSVLLLAFCCPTFAGEVPNPPAPPPPPAPLVETTEPTPPDTTGPEGTANGEEENSLTQIVLTLLAGVLY